jgi:HPt (histidine-containing phosphotransfer) domain-containing protein
LPAADELRQHARQALEAGDRVAAAGMLHQLKGSAAAVGAEVLAQACAEAERRLRGEVGGAGDDAEALSVVDAAAGRTRAVLTVWLDALPPVREASSIPAGPLPEMLKADLHRLKSLLALADMEAVELYERLLALEPRLAAQDFARFNNLMEQMDLPAAAHELEGVLQGPDETL